MIRAVMHSACSALLQYYGAYLATMPHIIQNHMLFLSLFLYSYPFYCFLSCLISLVLPLTSCCYSLSFLFLSYLILSYLILSYLILSSRNMLDDQDGCIVSKRDPESAHPVRVASMDYFVPEKVPQPKNVLESLVWDREKEVDRARERFQVGTLPHL